VLAVVGQQPIAVLAYPGARSTDDLSTIELRPRMESDPHGPAGSETSERDFLHWPPAQAVRKSRVVHYPAGAYVYSVMQIPTTRSDDM
jgi:hypothetical protein